MRKHEFCFGKMPIAAYGEVVVPTLIQKLVYRGLIAQCNAEEIKITHLGKQRVSRNVEANAFYIL